MRMNDDYRKAITGTLTSPGRKVAANPTTFMNRTNIPLRMYWVAEDGTHMGFGKDTASPDPAGNGILLPGLPPGKDSPVSGCEALLEDSYWVFENALTGAFVTVCRNSFTGYATIMELTSWLLLGPNDIGPVPEPRPEEGIPLPEDSTRVVVGTGSLPEKNKLVIREQCWQRMEESFSIAPGESTEHSYTVLSGMQETSSSLSSLETAVSASAGVGWGPVSASVSASLSSSSTGFQQVTVTEQETTFVSCKHTARIGAESPEMFLHWQLVDHLTVYDWTLVSTNALQQAALEAKCVSTSAQPAVIRGPYPPRTPVNGGA